MTDTIRTPSWATCSALLTEEEAREELRLEEFTAGWIEEHGMTADILFAWPMMSPME